MDRYDFSITVEPLSAKKPSYWLIDQCALDGMSFPNAWLSTDV